MLRASDSYTQHIESEHGSGENDTGLLDFFLSLQPLDGKNSATSRPLYIPSSAILPTTSCARQASDCNNLYNFVRAV
jgi:hypothetical protein